MLRAPVLVVACLSGLALVSAAVPADACTCATSATSCRELSTADAVFEATVDALEAAPPGVTYSSARLRRIMLTDIKAIRGTPATTIVTPWSSVSCGYEFRPGVRYLVVAHRGSDGRLAVYMCGETQPLSSARTQLDYLETLSGPAAQTRVWGSVYRTSNAPWARMPAAVAGATVMLTGPAERTVTSDANGRFLITDLPRGSYSVAAAITANGATIKSRADRFTWKPDEPFACAEVGLGILTTGSISGVTRNEFGEPIANATAFLHEVDPATGAPGASLTGTMTDEQGRYAFSELPPGSYIATVNWSSGPTFAAPHPPAIARTASGSEVIALGQDDAQVLMPLQLERLAAINVEGTVRDANGAPVAGVQIGGWGIHHTTRYPIASRTVSGADGTFQLRLWRGQRYAIEVDRDGTRLTSVELVASAEPVTITLPR